MLTDEEKQIIEKICRQNKRLKEENRELKRLVNEMRFSLNEMATYSPFNWIKRLFGLQQQTFLEVRPLLRNR